MSTKICPYYRVNSLEEFNEAVKKMGHGQKEPLYDFPSIVGFDDIVFQCKASENIKPFTDERGVTYEYVLQSLTP